MGEFNVGQEFDCCAESNVNCADAACTPAQRFEIGVEDVITHEDWDVANALDGNDIALIRLPSLVETQNENEKTVREFKDYNSYEIHLQRLTLKPFETFFQYVMPVCLPWRRSTFGGSLENINHNLYVIGWGRSFNEGYSEDIAELRSVSILYNIYVPYFLIGRSHTSFH